MVSIRELLKLIRPYRGRIVVFFFFANLMMIFNLLSIVISVPFLEVLFQSETLELKPPEAVTDVKSATAYGKYMLGAYIEEHGQEQAITLICILIIIIYFFKNLFRYLSVFTIIPVRYGVSKSMRDRLFKKVLELPIAYYNQERKGNIIVKMTTDIEEFRKSTLNMLESVLKDPLAIITSFAIMVSLSPRLTLISLLLVLFIAIVVAGVSSRIRQKSTKAQIKMGVLTSIVEEAIGGMRIVKSFNALNYKMKKFERENNAHKWILTRISWRLDSASPLSEFFGAVALSGLLIFGGRSVAQGEISAGDFLTILGIFWSMVSPIKNLSKSFFNIKKGLGAADRIYELLETTSNIVEQPNPKGIHQFKESIDYKDVTFSYTDDRPILEKISFKLQKGQILAIVGASGSGKSTLVDLLPRFYDIQAGQIQIDGIDIREYKIEDLRGLMGIVSQEPILFNDTIRNNISFGIEEITDEAIISAAKMANAHDFILETEAGYDTIIGDRGVKLSGGQRQRLTIARAILRNPQILILDEATSSLDSKSEQLVQDALYQLMRNRTSIVIAHRLSTIQNADEIIVLQEGEIVERGTHETLIKKEGIYTKLVELQKL